MEEQNITLNDGDRAEVVNNNSTKALFKRFVLSQERIAEALEKLADK